MKFLKTFIKWQFWTSLLLMGVVCYGLYHFIIKVGLQAYTNHGQEIEIPDLASMDIQEAMRTLDSLKLTYEIDSIRFDSAKLPYAVLDFYPAKGFKVKEGRKVLIKSNPKGWRPTTLPDIVGKSKRLAFTQLKLAGLSVGDTLYEPDLAKDAVLRVLFKGKQISKDSELPRFAKVDLVLGKGLDYGVDMADLIGLTLDEARSSILSNRFDVGRLTVEDGVVDSAMMRVFYQYPLPGDNYDQGLPVDLWLSNRDINELKPRIRELDIQYRNFGPNDSLALSKMEKEMNIRKGDEGAPNTKPKESTRDLPKDLPTEQPKGMEVD